MLLQLVVCFLFRALAVLGAKQDNLPHKEEIKTNKSSEKERDTQRKTNSWDVLIFTQSWPPAECRAWLQYHKNGECRDFSANNNWTIHGIWPSRWNSDGPSFCDNSNLLLPKHITKLKEQMKEQWPSIDKSNDGYNFWNYQWKKHGTCSTHIRQLSSQYEYFSVGLNWNLRFSPREMLDSGGITPGKEYNLVTIWDALTHSLSVDPQITCNRLTKGKQYLTDIRICFNKKLIKIDCLVKRGVQAPPKGTQHERLLSNTNCKLKEPVKYLE